ncbi:hypothetical protein CON65_18420 [Bacillus pseudomycoides]|uniref:Uncharacterized protein n=1 Tax=Bacillus pseudomycoides TaxID=64104 RepID=A0AA91V9R9_9BACI|nr:hypothetical protein COO03_20935 [Bacillus sp. AFS098217]PED81197.1 hypothetical protein CON65_18420 [Bacillus pseudomycoides]PEU16518.1 hypothetical protein CN524_04025 [Bacillus sp. AFS019443]PEU21470.1 hypothetical protein CN525_02000 [Bacillus sp. AFS014408]PFW60684.1 hypothetical protein COL20_20980 [Bacillus sp. AFS075034]
MLPLLIYLAIAARMFGGFASSYEANCASSSEAPSPSYSERAASAFITGNEGIVRSLDDVFL